MAEYSLVKFISRFSNYSRREAEKLIKEAKVKLDNKICFEISKKIPINSNVTVNGKLIEQSSNTEIWALAKPRGYITSKKDTQDRKTIYDLFPQNLKYLMPIGRLDMNSEGLLLLTNDGELKRYYELPENKIDRVYRVRVLGKIPSDMKNKIERGIKINSEYFKVKKFIPETESSTNNWVQFILHEGKNREIRKICKFFNLKVNRLIRTSYGKFKLGKMKNGEIKLLEEKND